MLIKNTSATTQVSLNIGGLLYTWAPSGSQSVPDSLISPTVLAQIAAYQTLVIVFTGSVLNGSWVMDVANGNGAGVRSVKGLTKVYGHSSAPAADNNMPVGFFKVWFDKAYSQYFGGYAGEVSPLSGTSVASTAIQANHVYVITSLGNTDWHVAGLDANQVPAVGMAFSAKAAGTGTGTCQAPSASDIYSLEVVGDPNTTINATGGGYIIMQCLGLPASGQVPAVTQPADGTVMGATFDLG